MRPINERPVLIFILTIISVATLLCLIGLTTPGWTSQNIFSRSIISSTLCVMSLILLLICLVIGGIILSGIIQYERLPLIFFSLLILSTIILLAAFTSFFSVYYNYSFSIMVASFTFTYLSSIITTYWLFGIRGNKENLIISSKGSRPKLDILT